MTFSKEERYRSFDSASEEELVLLTNRVNQSKWRQTYHIQPPHGLLNDPNGFSYFNGKYHLFYQWFPLEATHGLKHWNHLTSEDLVSWQDEGIVLTPEYDFESHGIFSGTAFNKENKLHLFYTGNKRDDNWERHSSQCLAYLTADSKLTKLKEPVIPSPPKGYTHNFRDPKVVQFGNIYHLFVGGQTENLKGCLLVYSSEDLINWRFIGEMATNEEEFGFMWECPDFFRLDNQDVLLLSPQGLKKDNHRFNNIYHSGVFIGQYDVTSNYFNTSYFQELDNGFDFYAPQTMETPDGRRLLIGWMGLPDIEYPSDCDGWAGCLTIPRELRIKDGSILQVPIKEIEELRGNPNSVEVTLINERKRFETISSKAIEIELDLLVDDNTKAGISFHVGNEERTDFYLDSETQQLILDRELTGKVVASLYGTKRYIPYKKKEISIRLFIDTSSVEVFVNQGESVFTSRLFPTNTEFGIELFSKNGTSEFKLTSWSIKK